MIKSRKITWAEHVDCREKTRNTYKLLAHKSERKLLHAGFQCRSEDGTEIGPNAIGCEDVNWICVIRDKEMFTVVNTARNFRVAQMVASFLTRCPNITLSKMTLLDGVNLVT
jgi:hypothetical protein